MARALMPFKVVLFALLYILIFAAYVIHGTRSEVVAFQNHQRVHGLSLSKGDKFKQGSGKNKKYARRMMIGSTPPNCTYNECRGCKYKCRAEQVPVEGNDPINSAYHYRCVCHR